MAITIPASARKIIDKLDQAGFEAYVVGGCVRDSLLGVQPKDWDLCTAATPEQMQKVFAGWHVVETGLKHGTLTVVLDHVPYEVTTFRTEGTYTDHRHPDHVSFVDDVREDLSRRDFTVNAMAYHPGTGIVDLFGGQQDLRDGVIRCVGRAEERFTEDALRILRALRFASRFGFAIEEETAAAIHALYPTMKDVAGERIRVELEKLLCGKAVGRILREYADVITFLIPELAPCIGFDQRTHHHRFTVWEHTVQAVERVEATPILRFSMLMHDSGKPAVFFIGEDGKGHAWGHPAKSAEYTEALFDRLRMDNTTRDHVITLVKNHDIGITTELLRRRLAQFGEDKLRELLKLQLSDNKAKGTTPFAELEARFAALEADLDALIATDPCVTMKQLAVNGNDLIRAGIAKGPALGNCLQALLDAVVDGTLPNDRDALLTAAAQMNEHPT